MTITYQRDIDHCERTTYARHVTIKTVENAQNSDNLDVVTFNELGWNAIVRRDQFKINDIVFFIPAESVLPFELSELLGVTNYLSKGKVRVTKLRGNRSEGLVVDFLIVEEYIPYIMKWEDLPSIEMRGDALPRTEVNPRFEKFYKMENILNEPNTFKIGEPLVYSEKIHGTSVKFGYFANPITDEYQLYVGSNNIVLKEGTTIYWRTVKKLIEKLPNAIPQEYVFYGEIYGRGIQDLHYGVTEPNIVVFAIKDTMKDVYVDNDTFIKICEEYKIPYVKRYHTVFDSIDTLRDFADVPSEYTDNHVREGIVIVSKENPNRMVKCISFKYLTRSGKKTERR